MSKPAKDVKKDLWKKEVKTGLVASFIFWIFMFVVQIIMVLTLERSFTDIPRMYIRFIPVLVGATIISVGIPLIKVWIQEQTFSIQRIIYWLRRIAYWYIILALISTLILGVFKDSYEITESMLPASITAIPLTLLVLGGLHIYQQKSAMNIKFLVGVLLQIGFIAILVYGTINFTIPAFITGSPDFQLNPVLLTISTVLMAIIIYLLFWGNITLGLKRYDDAIAHTNFWIRLRPNSATLYIRRAAQQIAKDDQEAARSDVEYAKSIAPNHPETLNQVANLYIEFGDFETALETVENALQSLPEVDPKIEASLLSTQTTIYLLLADYDMANALCKEMLKLDIPELEQDPFHSDAYQKWGTSFLLSGDYERALNEFEKAKALTTNMIPPLVGIAATHYRMGNLDAVRETWRELQTKHTQWNFDEIESSKSNIPAFAAIVRESYEAAHS